MPPPEKLRSRHRRKNAIPVVSDRESGSGDDESSEMDADYNGERRYSIESSPVDGAPVRRFAKGSSTSSEVGSRGTSSAPRQKRSSEFASRVRRSNGSVGVASYEEYHEESYSYNVPIHEDTIATVDKDPCSDIQTAPPFYGCDEEINPAPDQISTSRSCGSAVGSDVKKDEGSLANAQSDIHDEYGRGVSIGVATAPCSLPLRRPDFHESGHGPWQSVIAYDACTRLCLHSWARGCMEAPIFLENESALLRDSFGLQHILLQSEEDLLAKRSLEIVCEGSAPMPKRTIGKMKVQVRKVRMSMDMPSGCSFPSLKMPMVKMDSLWCLMSNLRSSLSSGCGSLHKVRVLPRLRPYSCFLRHSLAYIHASSQCIKQVPGILKKGVTTLLNSSSYDVVQEAYSCHLRLKSLSEEDGVRMQPGSGETHVFFPDSLGDNLFVEVYDSKGKFRGRALAQLASILEDPSKKLCWWPIYGEANHILVGRIQLHVNYATTSDEDGSLKCGFVVETVAYDIVLEVALKVQHFHQRNLLLHGSWKWLLTEFASYYGVSDAYTKLRYLYYVMDVATPTADCLMLVHDLLVPVILKSRSKNPLSHQENRVLGEIEEQTEKILALVFENYKSLDESSASGLVEIFRPANGSPAPALVPAVKLYTLIHDILSPESQLQLYGYFQAAAKKRSRRHLLETDEFVANKTESSFMDAVTLSNAYQKMKILCFNIRDEIFRDIEIYNQHILPSFIDLPNISASIYSVELSRRLCAFLVACPPAGPCPPVSDLVIATADFEKDLASWNICPVKGRVDAKELFHSYILLWIQDRRRALLQSCKLDKVKWSGIQAEQLGTPFVDQMYDRLKGTLNEYEIIIRRWPEYMFVLENAIADIEKAVSEALEKLYADMLPKKFGLKYVRKLARLHSIHYYTVSDEMGTLLNTMKRMLDVLCPKIEMQLKSWSSCMPTTENTVAGERLGEVTFILRAKFKSYLQTVVEKLSENTRASSATKLKKIIQDTKDDAMESDIRSRVQPLKDQFIQTVNHLHRVFEGRVFVLVCRGYWERMGQFLGKSKREQVLLQRSTYHSVCFG